MDVIKGINSAARFLLEICVLFSIGTWGFRTGSGWFLKILLGIGAPLLIAVIWGMFGAPKAPHHLKGFSLLILELFIFGSGVAALFVTKNDSLAWGLAGLVVVNRIIMFALG